MIHAFGDIRPAHVIDHAFISAVNEGHSPNGCVTGGIAAMETLDRIGQPMR